MADLNAHYCTKMLHHHGFLTRADMTSQFAGISEEQVGRADLACSCGGRAVNVEIKQGKTGFMLSNWREPQREWAAWTTQPPFSTPYYLFLTLGEHPATYDPAKYLPKRSWLIPYDVLLEIDSIVTPHQKTLPMRVGKGMKKEMQDRKLDAITLLGGYELEWNKSNALAKPSWLTRASELSDKGKTEDVISKSLYYGTFWTVPRTHPFYQEFILDNETDTERIDCIPNVINVVYNKKPVNKHPHTKKQTSKKRVKMVPR